MLSHHNSTIELIVLPSLPSFSPTQILFAAWFVCMLVFVVKLLWLSRRKAQLPQVYDDCSAFNCQFKYVGIFRFGEGAAGFDTQNSSVLIDLLDLRDRFITRLALPPNWLNKRSQTLSSLYAAQQKAIRQIKFQLNRSQQMPDIGAIRISHDCFLPVKCTLYVHSFDLTYAECDQRIHVPIHRPLYVLGPDAGFVAQVYPANVPLHWRVPETLDFDAHDCAMAATRFALFLFTLLNFSYVSSAYLAAHTAPSQLWWSIGAACAGSAMLSLIIQQAMFQWFRRTRRTRFVNRALNSPTGSELIDSRSPMHLTTSRPKASHLPIDESSSRSSIISVVAPVGAHKKPISPASTPWCMFGQTSLLIVLGTIGLSVGLIGHQIAVRLPRYRQALWRAWYIIYSVIGMMFAILITLIIKCYLPTPQPKEDAHELEQLRNQKPAEEKIILTTYVDLVAIGQSNDAEDLAD